MCINCVRTQVDISEGIPKQITLNFCRNCERYLQPPASWVSCELESKELLSICLKRLKGLSKVRLVDANFVWTEPHSKRVKVKLTIQKEIFAASVLQQTFIIEAVVCNLQCPECTKLMAKDTWKAVVQLRQKVDHKRTFFYLEQLILKHAVHKEITNIKQTKDGLDLFYSSKNHAVRMLDFLQAVVPIKYKTSEQLISEDIQSGTANYKFTFSAEIVPICKDDLVVLPKKVAASCSNISQVVLCSKVGSSIHFMDPLTLRHAEMNSLAYWRVPFDSLCSHKDLTEFYVIDVDYEGVNDGKFGLASAIVAKSCDFGVNNQTFSVRTHLGFVLKPGDVVLGYDLSTSNFNSAEYEGLEGSKFEIPDVFLVKKSYKFARQNQGKNARIWKLKTLDKEMDDSMLKKGEMEKLEADYEGFMRDIEEDPTLRSSINLYKNLKAIQQSKNAAAHMPTDSIDEAQNDEAGDNEIPEIDIADLLDDMEIKDDSEA